MDLEKSLCKTFRKLFLAWYTMYTKTKPRPLSRLTMFVILFIARGDT